MPYNVTTGSFDLSDNMLKLQAEKKAGIELQLRKHADWDDNYELYRNKVKTNRLTQRQAVNIPLMKETVKTLLSKIDDAPNIEWKEKSGDQDKELIFTEVWKENFKCNNMELIDILDKKNVLLYGLSVKKLNICDYGVDVSILDTYDMVLDPTYNPWDLESARFLIHQNIFRSIRDILADSRYTDAGKEDLKHWADSSPGLVQSDTNKLEWDKKMERMKVMSPYSNDFAYFAGGDRMVNLTEHYTKVWNNTKQEFERRVVVYADNKVELMNELLTDLIGVDFWPFVIWSEDPETNDVYPDSVADLVRTPNKVINIWFSQLIENRTLKNFQMHWFLPSQGYTPQTYTPGPGVMLPAPPGEDINKVIMPVQISGLDDTMQAIAAITTIVERGSGATAIDKGQAEPGTQTLGEVQILVGKANERTTAMAKFYRLAWYQLACKWRDMMMKNAPKFIKLYKAGGDGKLYEKRVYQGDWVSKAGYEPMVISTSEQESDSVKTMQKFAYVVAQSPNNIPLKQIAMRRQLDSLDLTPEELKAVEEGEKQAFQPQMTPEGAPGAPGAPGTPQAPGSQLPPGSDMSQIHQLLGQL